VARTDVPARGAHRAAPARRGKRITSEAVGYRRTRAVLQDLSDRDGVLAWLPELRPVPCDRVVQGQRPRSANWCTSNATKGLLAEKIQYSASGRQPNVRSRMTSPCRSTHNCATAPQLRDGAASLHQVHAVGQCRCVDTNIFW
jgi:hypothetical protein